MLPDEEVNATLPEQCATGAGVGAGPIGNAGAVVPGVAASGEGVVTRPDESLVYEASNPLL
jgi:hypothetical protein